MEKILLYATFILAFSGLLSAESKKISLTITNKSKLVYKNEVVAVDWKLLNKNLSKPAKDNIYVTDAASGKKILSQVCDNNGDGIFDELLFIASFNAGERKDFLIEEGTDGEELNPKVSVKYVKGRDDIAWESDRIAFRLYGPALAKDVNNGIDIWTKRVKYPIVEKWYAHSEQFGKDGKDTYHVDRGEGADFYSVGKSLGAGSAALWKNDSLYQPGVYDSYKIIESGPLRVVFEVNYKPVFYTGEEIIEKRRISIDAGSNLNKIELFYKGKKESKKLEVATGIVKRKNVTSYYDKNEGLISLWGLTNDEEINGFLGIGVMVPAKTVKEIKDTEKHLLIISKCRAGEKFTYYSGAGWTLSGDFKDESDWNEYLKIFSAKLKNKFYIKIK